ncbi:MAG: hypothetical protein AB8H79_11515 [Myxococcota bacterium]
MGMLRLFPVLVFLCGCVTTSVTPDLVEDPLVEDPGEDPADPAAPVSDAGEDFMAAPLQRVELDGTRSFDPNGLTIIPQWSFIRVPKGSQATMERADDLRPHFFADLVGTYEIELGLQNTDGLKDSTPDRVVVEVVPTDSVYVQLRWNTELDLDLHLVPTGQSLWGFDDCTWCNPNPEWGVQDVVVDDASLDWDVIDGFGPETITIQAPADGRYTAYVDVYGQGGLTDCRAGGCPPTLATLDVYIDGALEHTAQVELDEAGQLWQAVEIDWPSGIVMPIDTVDWTELDDCQAE